MAIISNAQGPKVSVQGIGQGGMTNYQNQDQYGGGVGVGGGMGGGGGLFGNMQDPGANNNQTNTEKSDAEKKEIKKTELINMVKQSLGEEFWGEGQGSVSFFNNHLIVRQSLLGFKLMSK